MAGESALKDCADQLRELRAEMREGFAAINADLREGAVQMAQQGAKLQSLTERFDRRTAADPTPLGSVRPERLHWAAKTALQSLIVLSVGSFGGFLIFGWANHVVTNPPSKPGLAP